MDDFKLSSDPPESPLVPRKAPPPQKEREEPYVDAEGVIEGSFTADADDWKGQPSGFFCKKCRTEVLTGSESCHHCGFRYRTPTLPLWKVKTMGASWMIAMNTDRWSEDQLRWLNEQSKKRR